MITQPAERHVTHLFRYSIASADMYYAEMEQRDVFLSYDGQGNFRICGEIVGGGSSTATDLFRVFLEYGLYCCSWCNMAEALYHMQDFGECFGRSLAAHLKDIVPPSMLDDSTVQVLKCIFETADVSLSIENIGGEVRIVITDFPLDKAAECSGLRNVELARHGINSMCQTLIQGINPSLHLSASSDARSEFIYTISTSILPDHDGDSATAS